MLVWDYTCYPRGGSRRELPQGIFDSHEYIKTHVFFQLDNFISNGLILSFKILSNWLFTWEFR